MAAIAISTNTKTTGQFLLGKRQFEYSGKNIDICRMRIRKSLRNAQCDESEREKVTGQAKSSANSAQSEQPALAMQISQSNCFNSKDRLDKRSNDSSEFHTKTSVQVIHYVNSLPRNWIVAISMGNCANTHQIVRYLCATKDVSWLYPLLPSRSNAFYERMVHPKKQL